MNKYPCKSVDLIFGDVFTNLVTVQRRGPLLSSDEVRCWTATRFVAGQRRGSLLGSDEVRC
jgi:hypothetical protein